jgi:hypothetical protein
LENLYLVILSFYVDDYLGVADSECGAAKKIADIIEINRRGNLNVANWTCNSRAVLETIPLKRRSKELKFITPDAEIPLERVLGLVWDPENDNFKLLLNCHKVKDEISNGAVTPTKREVLNLVHLRSVEMKCAKFYILLIQVLKLLLSHER